MADKHHIWVPGEDPPTIRPHSVAKHRVIQSYLTRYVEVLTRNVRVPKLVLTLVDGFCGGGVYTDASSGELRYGSPIRMMEAMADAESAAQEKRTNEFELAVEYYFIDESSLHCDFLHSAIRDTAYRDNLDADKTQIINRTFEESLESIIERIETRGRGQRAIFVLDQFGYVDVPMSHIRKILSRLDNAEVILTFATDALINYLTTNETTQKILEKVGLEISPTQINTLKQKQDWRRAIQFTLHDEIQRRSGARYYTPFFIRTPEANRDFWLIHLSGHSTARDVMVGLHWAQNTSFSHYGRSGMNMLGYDPGEDVDLTGQSMLPGFFFDETARASSLDMLIVQLPELIFRHNNGVSFAQLFATISNGVPATSTIVKQALADLCSDEIIKIESADGTVKRRTVQRNDDVIRPIQRPLSY